MVKLILYLLQVTLTVSGMNPEAVRFKTAEALLIQEMSSKEYNTFKCAIENHTSECKAILL